MHKPYDTDSTKEAAEVVKNITSGGLDYLVNNAAIVSHISEWKTMGDLYAFDIEVNEGSNAED